MGDFLPALKVLNEVLEITGFNGFELYIAELFNKLSSITLKKLFTAPRCILIWKILVLNNRLNMQFPIC